MNGQSESEEAGEQANGDAFCVGCGCVIAREVRHCTECGVAQPVEEGASRDSVAGRPEVLSPGREYCSDCGAVVDVGTPFCGNCGAVQRDDDGVDASPSDWIIGFAPGSTVQNVVAGVFFYFFLYPVGVPTLLYGYLTNRRRWPKRKAGALAVAVAIGFLLVVFS